MTALPRTPAEIKARIHERESHDLLAFEWPNYLEGLAFEDAREFLKEDATAEDWPGAGTVESVTQTAKEYFSFAIGKAIDHRGISANRSVSHYQAWLWLLAKDEQIDWERYGNYGAPILKQIAELMCWEWPASEALNRMARGLPCEPDCMEGCGE